MSKSKAKRCPVCRGCGQVIRVGGSVCLLCQRPHHRSCMVWVRWMRRDGRSGPGCWLRAACFDTQPPAGVTRIRAEEAYG